MYNCLVYSNKIYLNSVWEYCYQSASKGAGTPDYYPLYTASTLFYSDYFVDVLWAHLATIRTRIFLYFAYLQEQISYK